MNKKGPVLGVMLALLSAGVSAQVLSGGNVSVTADENGYYADIAPTLGYQVKNVRAGVNPFISYSDVKDADAVFSFGGRTYAEVVIASGVFLHGEFEATNTEVQ